ncbi:unnamed protein product [Ixodes hexagonus]
MDSGAMPMRCCFSLRLSANTVEHETINHETYASVSKYLAMYCAWVPVSTFFSPVLASYWK